METLTEKLSAKDKYIALYRQEKELIGENDPAFIRDLREKGIALFAQKGFPAKKEENFKYTHLEPVFDSSFAFHFKPREITFDMADLFRCDIPQLDTHVVTVLDGFYHNRDGSRLTVMDNGVIFGSLREAIRRYPDLVEAQYGKVADMENEPFVALNTAFAQDGVFVYIPRNKKLDKPIQIIHLLLSDASQMVHHRNLFIAEENSEGEVIICDHTLSPHLFLTNSVTEIRVDQNARFDLIRVQNEHNNSAQVTNTWIRQEKDSVARHNTITLHGGMIRNNLRVKLAGEGASNEALGLFLIDKMQHVDNYTLIEHVSPNCSSNQHYKGVLDDAATGAFNGKIHVFRDAQKTQAYQSNNNILLTDTAKMNTKPQLEIYADDVKCSHGATVGQLDENALFYMQARGIPKAESRLLLMFAFAQEVISRINEPALKERIGELVDKRLRGELSRCNNCAMNCKE
ncbi:MAG: Fe-S cluster assembly protein SufD [Bacteroidota bacterium]